MVPSPVPCHVILKFGALPTHLLTSGQVLLGGIVLSSSILPVVLRPCNNVGSPDELVVQNSCPMDQDVSVSVLLNLSKHWP